jgi:hypothetical protein
VDAPGADPCDAIGMIPAGGSEKVKLRSTNVFLSSLLGTPPLRHGS